LKERHDRTVRLVLAGDVQDAFLHLNAYRLAEKGRLGRPIGDPAKKAQAEPREVSCYTSADSDFAALPLALVPYFDAEQSPAELSYCIPIGNMASSYWFPIGGL
jgi:hypothetical protein